VLRKITPKTSYLIARTITTVTAMVFAFIYSKALGLNNRSLIAFIMTSNALIWLLVTSGTTLTLRKLTLKSLDMKKIKSFNSLLIIEFVAAIVIFLVTIELYSLLKNYLTPNFIIGSIIYFLLSGFHLITVEMLLASNNIRLSGILDASTIFLQVFFFMLLNLTFELSISVRLLISFSLSYLIIFFIGLINIIKSSDFSFRFANPQVFFAETRGNHLIGVSLGVVDRMDRFLIGATLPTAELAKYAVMSGTISIFRFFPDAISKLLISRTHFTLHAKLKNWLTVVTLAVLFGSVLVVSSQFFIKLWLGNEWLLPISVSLCFVVQELLRGIFQISAHRYISRGRSHFVSRVSLQLPFLSITLALLLISFIGIIGVPISFSIAFIFSLFSLRLKERDDKS